MPKTSPPPCELYIVRHAIAAERGEAWPDDDKRPLTEKGIVRFKDGLRGLRFLDVEIDEIFTSPLVRAKQTAELLAADISGKPSVKPLEALAPGSASDDVIKQLARVARRRRIALVGHEPGLGELAAHFLGTKRPLEFRKGGVCRIDLQGLTENRPGSLIWFVTPKMLRHLGKQRT